MGVRIAREAAGASTNPPPHLHHTPHDPFHHRKRDHGGLRGDRGIGGDQVASAAPHRKQLADIAAVAKLRHHQPTGPARVVAIHQDQVAVAERAAVAVDPESDQIAPLCQRRFDEKATFFRGLPDPSPTQPTTGTLGGRRPGLPSPA